MFPFGGDLLAIYLQDHLAGATTGVELARRARDQNRDNELGAFLDDLAQEIAEDREELREIMRALDIGADRLKMAAAWTSEKVGRLKLNGRLTSYSPLSRVLELEGLIMGVTGKLCMWQSLHVLAHSGDDRLDAARYDRLIARAERQLAALRDYHDAAAAETFSARSPARAR
jgi:hypothetical protein